MRELIDFLKIRSFHEILIFKSEEERRYLREWIHAKSFTEDEVSQGAESTDSNSRQLCPKKKAVGKKAFGSGSNGVMIILNSPSMLTGSEIKIYKKESFLLLKKMLGAIGLKMDECYITNLIKSDIDDIMVKLSDIIGECLSCLEIEIGEVSPRLILIIGDMLPLEGLIKAHNNIKWFNTEHTVTLIKNPQLKRGAWETLKLLQENL